MGEAGGKPTRFRLRTVMQMCPADAPPVPLPEGFFLPRIAIRSAADVEALRRYEELMQAAKLMAKRKPQKPRKRKAKRKQVKQAQEPMKAKLQVVFPPRGKPPRKLSTPDVGRQAGIIPNQWRSLHRLLGREPKK
jgi:hypothetical protein